MNEIRRVITICLSAAIGIVHFAAAYSPFIDGAIADVKIKVVDDRGEAVPDAAISVTFYTAPEKVDIKRGKTDALGYFFASGRCIGEAHLWIRKDGYYETKMKPVFRTLSDTEVERLRKWSSGTVETTATLKKKRNPVTTSFHAVDYLYPIPATNEIVRLDLETFKWCPPYGNGKHDDLHMLYEVWQDQDNWLAFHKKLTITAPNCVDGFYRRKVDATSNFRYEYKAVTNEVYDKTIVYNVDRRSGKIDVVELPLDDEFFTFRMRTVTNEVGEVVQAYYGRIAERSGHMFGLRMKTWFNTKLNDTNLEDARVR